MPSQVLAYCISEHLSTEYCATVLNGVISETTPPAGCTPARGRGCPGDATPFIAAPVPQLPAVPRHLRPGAGAPCASGTVSPYVAARAAATTERACVEWLRGGGGDGNAFTAQFGQDAFVYYNYARCMDGPGSYVDVGAYHPWVRSNTWFLDVCLGWRGICVEGNPSLLRAFAEGRSCRVVGQFLSRTRGAAAFEASTWEMLGRIVPSTGAGGEVLHSTATFADALDAAGWPPEVCGLFLLLMPPAPLLMLLLLLCVCVCVCVCVCAHFVVRACASRALAPAAPAAVTQMWPGADVRPHPGRLLVP